MTRIGALIITVAAFVSIITTAYAQSAEARYEECQSLLIRGAEAGTFHDISVAGAGLDVVIDADFWRGSDFATKLGIARAVDCWFFKGKRGELVYMRFLDHRTHKVLGEGYATGESFEVFE